MRNIKLTLEYDGTDFHGFQRQRDLRTVQGALEGCFSRLLREPVKVVGAGRTDAGVHATGQVVSFAIGRAVPTERLMEVLNAVLPRDVKVQNCKEVAEGFHARRSARSRTYRYSVIERAAPSPILGRYALIVPQALDVERMAAAADGLVGRHDFRAFQGGSSPAKTTERRLIRADCRRTGRLVSITVEADSFLYHMVRLITSALLAVGRGEAGPDEVEAAVVVGERIAAGRRPAPACGLCLVEVSYSDGLAEEQRIAAEPSGGQERSRLQ